VRSGTSRGRNRFTGVARRAMETGDLTRQQARSLTRAQHHNQQVNREKATIHHIQDLFPGWAHEEMNESCEELTIVGLFSLKIINSLS